MANPGIPARKEVVNIKTLYATTVVMLGLSLGSFTEGLVGLGVGSLVVAVGSALPLVMIKPSDPS